MSDPGNKMAILPADDPRAPLRRFMYVVIITIAAGIVAGQIASAKPLLSANDRSRWCTIWSLVERDTYRIDEINRNRKWQTIDRVTIDGHLYSSKPPLLATLVSNIYRFARNNFGWDLIENTEEVTRLVLYLVNFVPFVISLVLMAKIVERYGRNDFGRIFIMAAAAFGTLLSTFQIALNNHTVAAASVMFAIYPALRILADGERRPAYFALSGFYAAFACTNELPAALFAGVLFVMLFIKAPKQTLVWFAPAAIIPLAALLYTNYQAVGTWKPSYALYGTEAYTRNPDGTGTYWDNPKGIDKGGDSPLVYLLHCTLGHHGIFSLTPVFLLTIGGWMQIRREKNSPLASMLWLGLALTPAIIAFYLTRTENYNYGGMTSGLRWAFWLIPFWLIALIPLFERYGDCWRFRTLAVVFLLISVFSAAYPVANPWQHPWLFKLMERWNWIDYSRVEPPGNRTPQFSVRESPTWPSESM